MDPRHTIGPHRSARSPALPPVSVRRGSPVLARTAAVYRPSSGPLGVSMVSRQSTRERTPKKASAAVTERVFSEPSRSLTPAVPPSRESQSDRALTLSTEMSAGSGLFSRAVTRASRLTGAKRPSASLLQTIYTALESAKDLRRTRMDPRHTKGCVSHTTQENNYHAQHWTSLSTLDSRPSLSLLLGF